MCRLSVGGIKGETWGDIELNFILSLGLYLKRFWINYTGDWQNLIGHNPKINLFNGPDLQTIPLFQFPLGLTANHDNTVYSQWNHDNVEISQEVKRHVETW